MINERAVVINTIIQFQKKINGQVFSGKVTNVDGNGVFVLNVKNSKGGSQLFPPFYTDSTWVPHSFIIK